MHTTDTYTQGGSLGHGFVIGLLCGAAVGAAIGLLLAPKSGAEMRQTLMDSAGRFRRRAEETYSEASTAVNDLVDKSRSAIRRGKDKIDSTLEETRSAVASETTPRSAY